jgi:hypothetical protein
VLGRPRPGDDPRLLSLRAGLAVAEMLDGGGGLPFVQLKWPNDVIVDGRKVGTGGACSTDLPAGRFRIVVKLDPTRLPDSVRLEAEGASFVAN